MNIFELTAAAAAVADPTPQTCPAAGFQSVSVCVPVTVTPFATPGATVTTCCGDPIVNPGITPCAGVKNGVCSFTVTQNLCVKVPVVFGAAAEVGDTFVDCKGASADDICKNCGGDAPGIPAVLQRAAEMGATGCGCG